MFCEKINIFLATNGFRSIFDYINNLFSDVNKDCGESKVIS